MGGKEPTRYEFHACLTFCCFKFEHLKGVTAFAAIAVIVEIALIVVGIFPLTRKLLTGPYLLQDGSRMEKFCD